MAIKELVENAISENKVMMFAKSYCPYCQKSRELFQSLGQPYSTFELDLRDDGADIQAYLLEKTGQKTVPNIFINGQHIGGNDTIQAKHVSGELAKLLA